MLYTKRFCGLLAIYFLLAACTSDRTSVPDDLTFVSISVIRGSATPPLMKLDGEYYPSFASSQFLTVTVQSMENLFEPSEHRRDIIPHATYCRDWQEYTSIHAFDPTRTSVPSMEAAPIIQPDLSFEKLKTKEDYQAAFAKWEQRRPFTYEIYLEPHKTLGTGYVHTRAYDLRLNPDDVCIGFDGQLQTDASQSKLIVVPKAAISNALARATEKK